VTDPHTNVTRAAVLVGSLLGEPAAAGARAWRHGEGMEALGMSLALDDLFQSIAP
jgi:hypothetical protein